MSSKKCIICLRPAVNQVDHESLLSLICLGIPDDTLGAISQLHNSDIDIKVFCSRCQVYFLRLTKLNTKLKNLVGRVKQSYNALSVKIPNKVPSLDQFTLLDNEQIVKSEQFEENQNDQPASRTSGMQPVERNGLQKYLDANAGNCTKPTTANIKVEYDADSSYPVEVIAGAGAQQGHDTCQLTVKGAPKVRTSKQFQQRIVQIAPNRFQYGEYFIEEVDGLYKCGECGALKRPAKRYKMESIRKHISSRHKNTNPPDSKPPDSKTYACENCEAVYKTRNSLRSHEARKHGDPTHRFHCTECGKISLNRLAAMNHRYKIHRRNPQKIFKCEPCGKKFKRLDFLERHMAFVHKELEMHKCEQCGKTFGTRTGLKIHQNTHAGNRKFLYTIPHKTQSVEESFGDELIANIKQEPEVNILIKVEGTSEDGAYVQDEGQFTLKIQESIEAYQDNWLPKNFKLKPSQDVKRLSERDFVYKDEYPFQGTEFGFQCGLCPLVVLFCTYKPTAPWANLTRHMRMHHMGKPAKVQTTRTVKQKCIEVAPNRFQYGRYSFEKVDGFLKCGECGILKKPVEQLKIRSHKYMLKHIRNVHK